MVAGQALNLEMEVRLLPPQPKKEQAPARACPLSPAPLGVVGVVS